jgi:Zn-finger nucleic acid-binding protein
MQNPKMPAGEIGDALRQIDNSRVLALCVAGERQRQRVDREVSPCEVFFQAARLHSRQRADVSIRLTPRCREVDGGRPELEPDASKSVVPRHASVRWRRQRRQRYGVAGFQQEVDVVDRLVLQQIPHGTTDSVDRELARFRRVEH